MQAKSEIKRFVQEEIPEDNQLVAAHKQAGKKADKLQADLQSFCNELANMTIEEDECFGDEFFSNLVAPSAWLVTIPPALMSLTSMAILVPSLGNYIEVYL